jgi:hypothetical protein
MCQREHVICQRGCEQPSGTEFAIFVPGLVTVAPADLVANGRDGRGCEWRCSRELVRVYSSVSLSCAADRRASCYVYEFGGCGGGGDGDGGGGDG